MPSGTNTPNLNLLRIQALWQFGDAAFNRFIDDADNKLVGIAHLTSGMHWTTWKAETEYAKDDVVRWPNLKSHQYARCLDGGISDIESEMPQNNVTGSILTDGTVTWEVMSLTQASANGGIIKTWLGGYTYTRGDAVRYGDALYRAVLDHVASFDFSSDYLKWQEIYASIRFWKPNIYYYADDTVIYDDVIYRCTRAHKSVTSFEDDSSATPPVVGDEADWEIVGGAGGAKDWTTNTKYQYGQLVLVNGILYRSNSKHRSSNSFSTDIANWDLVDAQIHDWATSQYYVAGTLIAYNNVIYKCVTSHSSSANFETDISNWTLYHNHITVWDRNKSYYQGQIVLYENRVYKCNTTHVSPNEIVETNSTRNATFLDDISNFDVIYASLAVWAKNTTYKIGDIVLYNNEPFRCVNNHTSGNTNSSTIFDNITNDNSNCWERIGQRNPYITNWASDTKYDTNQLVLYRGTLYRCNTLHTSTSTFDPTKWDLVYANIQEWVTGTPYKLHSMVINNDRVYLCTTAHTSTTFMSDSSNWIEVGGGGGIADWESNKPYVEDTPIMYNGILYRCNTSHSSSSSFSSDASNWDIVYSSISTWTTGIYYPVNMLVSYNNLVYKCVTAHTASADFNTDIANWILYNNSITTWAASTVYKVGQVVLYDDVLYKCNANHVSASTFDVTKWNLIYANIRQYANNTVYKEGSIVIYNNQLYKCLNSHTSNSDYIDRYAFYTVDYVWPPGYLGLGSNLPHEQWFPLPIYPATIKAISYDMDEVGYVAKSDVRISDDGATFTVIEESKVDLPVNDNTVSSYHIYFECSVVANHIKFHADAWGYHGSSTSNVRINVTNLTVYTDNPNWQLLGNADTLLLDWQTGHDYVENDVVVYDNMLYRCTNRHTSSANFNTDSSNWELLIKIATKAQVDALFI